MNFKFRFLLLFVGFFTTPCGSTAETILTNDASWSEKQILDTFTKFEYLQKNAIGKIDQSKPQDYYEKNIIRAFAEVSKKNDLSKRPKLIGKYFVIMAMTYGSADEARGIYLAQIYLKFPELVEKQILSLESKRAKALLSSLEFEIFHSAGGSSLADSAMRKRLKSFSIKIQNKSKKK